MYGQTNCWALPDGDYAAFRGLNGEVYVMTERSALNLSYQARPAAAPAHQACTVQTPAPAWASACPACWLSALVASPAPAGCPSAAHVSLFCLLAGPHARDRQA